MQSINAEYRDQSRDRSLILRIIRRGARYLRICLLKLQGKIFGFRVFLGDSIIIGRRFNVRSAGDIKLGSFVSIGANLHLETSLEIGQGSLISSNVALIGNDHSRILGRSSLEPKKPISSIKIGENCWIGFGTIIIGNLQITSNVIVGAGSVVTRDLLESGIYVGVPAKLISK